MFSQWGKICTLAIILIFIFIMTLTFLRYKTNKYFVSQGYEQRSEKDWIYWVKISK
jgi:hypothetical protein